MAFRRVLAGIAGDFVRGVARPRVAVGLAVLGAIVLLVPGLGRFGIWEPSEAGIARQAVHLGARDQVDEALALPSSAYAPAVGVRLFGRSEAAARLPGVVLALVTLAAVGLAGALLTGLGGWRTGVGAALALAGFPLFGLGARQLTSDTPVMLGVALALAGFLALARDGGVSAGRALPVALVLAGLGIAAVWGGVLVGLLPVLGGFALAAVGALDDAPLRRAGTAAAVVAIALAALVAGTTHVAGEASWLLGGRAATGTAFTFAELIETLGFGLFPLGPVALLALGGGHRRKGAEDFGSRLLSFTVALGFGCAIVQLHLVGQSRLAFLPALALALGRWVREDAGRETRTALGVVGLGVLLVTRDLAQEPQALLSVHLPLGQRIAWPPSLSIEALVVGVGVVTALGVLTRLRRVGARAAPALLLGPPLVLAFGLAHGVVPALSPYLSTKSVMDRFAQLAAPGTMLGLYGVPARELGVFDRAHAVTTVLDSPAAVVAHVRQPRGLALVVRHQLVALDAAFAEARVAYAVADASSSRHLLLAQALPAGARDQNPLVAHVHHAGLAAPPDWAPANDARAPLATFGDAIKLLRADFPTSIARGRALPLSLLFRVTARPRAGQRIFVHLERPGEPLLNGDHDPVGGTFATQHWRAGDLIRDQHEIALPRFSTTPGSYRLLVGFWPGGDTPVRLPLTAAGPGVDDGNNRAYLGTVHIR